MRFLVCLLAVLLAVSPVSVSASTLETTDFKLDDSVGLMSVTPSSTSTMYWRVYMTADAFSLHGNTPGSDAWSDLIIAYNGSTIGDGTNKVYMTLYSPDTFGVENMDFAFMAPYMPARMDLFTSGYNIFVINSSALPSGYEVKNLPVDEPIYVTDFLNSDIFIDIRSVSDTRSTAEVYPLLVNLAGDYSPGSDSGGSDSGGSDSGGSDSGSGGSGSVSFPSEITVINGGSDGAVVYPEYGEDSLLNSIAGIFGRYRPILVDGSPIPDYTYLYLVGFVLLSLYFVGRLIISCLGGGGHRR